jgi:SAM-dependent methyltransferase
MSIQTKSFLRKEEYKALSGLTIDGLILDVGGSKKSGYHELIKGRHDFIVGNINDSYGIDIIFDAQQIWPFEGEYFDGVLFVNLLEHLSNYEIAISEAFRVLKKGKILVGVVPFMFNVHGSPNDFFRYTKAGLEHILSRAGFSNIRIKELGTGSFSVIYHTLLGFVRWNWLASLLIPVFSSVDRLVGSLKPGNRMSAVYMPLGYYFEAYK